MNVEQPPVKSGSCTVTEWSHFDQTFMTGCPRSCYSDNLRFNPWWLFPQSKFFVAMCLTEASRRKKRFHNWQTYSMWGDCSRHLVFLIHIPYTGDITNSLTYSNLSCYTVLLYYSMTQISMNITRSLYNREISLIPKLVPLPTLFA